MREILDEEPPKRMTVFDKEFQKVECAGEELKIYNLLFGQVRFDADGEELILPPAPIEGGVGPLRYKRSHGTEKTRDWNMIHYGAPGLMREIEMVEVFLRLPEPEGNPQRELAFDFLSKMPVLMMYEEDARRVVAQMERYFNPGVAVAHLDHISAVVTEQDQADFEKRQEQIKEDLHYRMQVLLGRITPRPRRHFQAIVFDAFPSRRFDSPEPGELVMVEYYPLESELAGGLEDEAEKAPPADERS